MKYPTLRELVAAYTSGELTAPLMLDNDNASVVVPEDENWINAETVYQADPHDLLADALALLGIPWEHA